MENTYLEYRVIDKDQNELSSTGFYPCRFRCGPEARLL